MVLGGFGWFQVVSGGFGWFRVVSCFINNDFLHLVRNKQLLPVLAFYSKFFIHGMNC